jgi:phosphopantothenoylcysteine decarboxylase/phosphopantothenate--cysteine ligase
LGYNRSLKNKKILITGGPTWVSIDPVRVVSNISSGELAHRIADLLCYEKAHVTLLEGPVTHQIKDQNIKIIPFRYFDELAQLLKEQLAKTHYDIVIHAAAVSDYQIKKTFSKKLKSNLSRLSLSLIRTPKLITQIKKIDPAVFLVGFKLETAADKRSLLSQAKILIREAKCDLVIANALNKNNYSAYIINNAGDVCAKANSRKEIAHRLIKTLKENL